jgi:hypothetical protein
VCAPRLQARPQCHIRHDTTKHQAITTTPRQPFCFSKPTVQASDVPADFAFCTAIHHSHTSRLKQPSLVQILPTAIVNSCVSTRRTFDFSKAHRMFSFYLFSYALFVVEILRASGPCLRPGTNPRFFLLHTYASLDTASYRSRRRCLIFLY